MGIFQYAPIFLRIYAISLQNIASNLSEYTPYMYYEDIKPPGYIADTNLHPNGIFLESVRYDQT